MCTIIHYKYVAWKSKILDGIETYIYVGLNLMRIRELGLLRNRFQTILGLQNGFQTSPKIRTILPWTILTLTNHQSSISSLARWNFAVVINSSLNFKTGDIILFITTNITFWTINGIILVAINNEDIFFFLREKYLTKQIYKQFPSTHNYLTIYKLPFPNFSLILKQLTIITKYSTIYNLHKSSLSCQSLWPQLTNSFLSLKYYPSPSLRLLPFLLPVNQKIYCIHRLISTMLKHKSVGLNCNQMGWPFGLTIICMNNISWKRKIFAITFDLHKPLKFSLTSNNEICLSTNSSSQPSQLRSTPYITIYYDHIFNVGKAIKINSLMSYCFQHEHNHLWGTIITDIKFPLPLLKFPLPLLITSAIN